MKALLLPILILLLINPAHAAPSVEQPMYLSTDEKLKKLAVKKGLIPEHADEAYCWREVEKKNTVLIWIVLRREDKVKLLDGLKEMFKQEDIIISKPSVGYVDQINRVMISNIKDGVPHQEGVPGIKCAFQTLAAMNGDYDDGRNRLEILREFLGEEMFEMYKEKKPRLYKYLLKLDTEN